MSRKIEYACKQCNCQFFSHKLNKLYCSNDCYKESRKKFVTKKCESCHQEFTVAYRFREQKTCNQKCFGGLISKRLNTKVEKCCLTCGDKYFVVKSYVNESKFCSYD